MSSANSSVETSTFFTPFETHERTRGRIEMLATSIPEVETSEEMEKGVTLFAGGTQS